MTRQINRLASEATRFGAMGEPGNAAHATTADDLLTILAGTGPDSREGLLQRYPTKMLRAAADLCGVDAEGLGRRAAITAILENF